MAVIIMFQYSRWRLTKTDFPQHAPCSLSQKLSSPMSETVNQYEYLACYPPREGFGSEPASHTIRHPSMLTEDRGALSWAHRYIRRSLSGSRVSDRICKTIRHARLCRPPIAPRLGNSMTSWERPSCDLLSVTYWANSSSPLGTNLNRMGNEIPGIFACAFCWAFATHSRS